MPSENSVDVQCMFACFFCRDAPVKKETSPIRAKESTRIPKPEKPEDQKPPVLETAKDVVPPAKRESEVSFCPCLILRDVNIFFLKLNHSLVIQ